MYKKTRPPTDLHDWNKAYGVENLPLWRSTADGGEALVLLGRKIEKRDEGGGFKLVGEQGRRLWKRTRGREGKDAAAYGF